MCTIKCSILGVNIGELKEGDITFAIEIYGNQDFGANLVF